MKYTGWLFLMLFAAAGSAEEKKVFVTVDKNNNLVFSDSPSPGASQVSIKDTGTAMAPVTSNILNEPTPTKEPEFQVTIAKPEQQGTIRDNNGTVYISGSVSPLFSQGLRVVLYLDGKQVAGPTGNANFILHDIERGEHQLSLELLNHSGKVIATSPATTFYMHRTSVISPK
jgi:hypothetical protein